MGWRCAAVCSIERPILASGRPLGSAKPIACDARRPTAGCRAGTSSSAAARRRLRAAGVRLRPGVAGADRRTVRFTDGSSLDADVVIWATGYRSDYSWIGIRGVARDGTVIHRRGATEVPGLYFLGLSWLHTPAARRCSASSTTTTPTSAGRSPPAPGPPNPRAPSPRLSRWRELSRNPRRTNKQQLCSLAARTTQARVGQVGAAEGSGPDPRPGDPNQACVGRDGR
jgi:Pyridine nucleotide-disulphide oxidoreductase